MKCYGYPANNYTVSFCRSVSFIDLMICLNTALGRWIKSFTGYLAVILLPAYARISAPVNMIVDLSKVNPLGCSSPYSDNIPAQVDHAVLFQQVIPVFLLRNHIPVVSGVIVDLDGDPSSAIHQSKVGIAIILVDVVKRILGIQKPRLLRPKGLGEQPEEQILPKAPGI